MTNPPSWLNLEHVWLPYTQMKTAALPVPVVSAKGVRLKTADGRELVDGIASWWTACHGYGHPHIVKSVAAQLETMPHVMFGGLAHEQGYKLAARLAGLLPGDLNHVFFSESGSVAVEVALKMAVQFWLNGEQGARNSCISAMRIMETRSRRWQFAIRKRECTVCLPGSCRSRSLRNSPTMGNEETSWTECWRRVAKKSRR